MPNPLFDPADFGIYAESDFQYLLGSKPALKFLLSKYEQKLKHARTRLRQVTDKFNSSSDERARNFWENWIPYHKDLVSALVHRVDYLETALAMLDTQNMLDVQKSPDNLVSAHGTSVENDGGYPPGC